MRLSSDGTLRLSPSDLSAHLACPHLTTLVAAGGARRDRQAEARVAAPRPDLPQGERARGRLPRAARGRRALDRPDPDLRRRGLRRRRGAAADRGGDPRRRGGRHLPAVPLSEDGRWRGFADFLERQPDGGYEPVDTKLARSAKPAHVLQLLFYAEQVGADLQGSAGRARPRRERARRARDVPRRRVRGVLPARPRAVPRRARRRARRRTAGRAATAGSATSGTCAGSSASTTTTSRSSPGCGARRRRR